ncbi:cation:proton antiporter family protein [Lactobacillus sp. ESL0677]|uniref:cation:proton antiporter family protein n=1 Tax=Lactobacillus sp. ESL0677 TaxID=2983208 RepID=UPI0023FA0BBB|nr:cation:proton antiporter family protein [Lactobacillus sp. ESL0677]WEV37040.1 cation:proton antiporter [Lactobacillus sp. ESL0677]
MDLSLVIVSVAAFLTPTLLARFKVSLIPTTVAEIIVGVILGRSCFNIIHINSVLNTLSTLGTIMLLFLSGMEIDFSLFKKSKPTTVLAAKKARNKTKESPLKSAIIAYSLTIVSSIILGVLFKVCGLFSDVFLSVILFATVSLGVMISILKENNLLGQSYGQTLLLFGVLGEIIPLLGLTIYSSIKSGNGGTLWLLSLVFLAAAYLLARFRNFFNVFGKLTKSTTQLDMRFAFLVIVILVVLATSVGAENILGAFLAGIVIKLLEPEEATEEKLNAIGYGFLIPFFFILTGVKLNLIALLGSKATLTLIPLLLVAFLVAKMPAYYSFKKLFSQRNALAGTFLVETTMTLVISGVAVAQNIHALNNQQGGALTLAAVLTCLIGPMLFKKLYQPKDEQLPKTIVHIIGTTVTSVATCHQLPHDWYDTRLYTRHSESYETYKNSAPVTLLDTMEPSALIKQGIFDTDILVITDLHSKINYSLAVAAKKYGVERVLVRLDDPDPNEIDVMKKELTNLKIEYFNTFDTGVGVFRTAIESPEVLRFITSTTSSLFEVTMTNARFDGSLIPDLPETDEVVISKIVRNGKFVDPRDDLRLQLGDHLIMAGPREVVSRLRLLLDNQLG